jgi:aldose 1-epimerase
VARANYTPRMTDTSEIVLTSGRWEAVVSSHGASLRGVTCDGETVATGYRGTANKQGGQGDVLIPFPGRVAGGRYTWDGVEHQLPLTDKDGPNAIHGFVRKMDWSIAGRSDSSVTFALHFAGGDGYPFPLDLRVRYALGAQGLRCESVITNAGTHDAPVAMGFHPYFSVGSPLVNADTLTLPFDEVLEFRSLIPTGRVEGVSVAGLDFRAPRVISDTAFNHCFLSPTRDADGLVRVRLSQGARVVTVWMDDAFHYVVLFTGDGLPPGVSRASLAIEPMSCGSDALNHPDWGLVRLAPGATMRGTWGVTVA